MCGIVGIVEVGERAVREDCLLRMRDAVAHRGPDDVGAWISDDRQVGLAHCRLAIIDLSPGGHQPMRGAGGHSWVVVNGEIYNYRELRDELAALGWSFRTGSDTEVLLAAYGQWGERFVEKLNGMFAFALFDEKHRRLLLARDRAGEKPLYLRRTAEGLVFASEMKAIMALTEVGRQVDVRALNFYLSYGYVPAPLALIEGIEKLSAATLMTVDVTTGRSHTTRYWSPPSYEGPVSGYDETELEFELERLLERSVRSCLVADVPVGISLSGGVDSSLVTAMAARVSPTRVRTFTVSFPDDPTYDEASFASLVAEHFGTEHHELVIGAEIARDLPEMISQFDEPLADSSLLPTFAISRLTRQHVTVALGGDGGDELFAGYPIYARTPALARRIRSVPKPLREIASRIALRALPVGTRGRTFLASVREDFRYQHVVSTSVFGEYDRWQLLSAEVRERLGERLGEPESIRRGMVPATDPVEWMTRTDFLTYLPDDILAKLDRASMRVALEMRAPWLDHQLIEFAFGRVPPDLKLRGPYLKYLPKRLARRILPTTLDIDRKQGFSVPIDRWIASAWRDRLGSSLATLADRRIVNERVAQDLAAGQLKGRTNNTRLFALLMLGGWMDAYKVEL